MLEMRWLQNGDERTLQFRYRVYREGFVPGLGGYDQEWTTWQDVPVTDQQGFRVA